MAAQAIIDSSLNYLLFRSDGRLKRSTYTDVNITVTLPDGVTACDIGTFTVWCELFAAIFTRVLIPRDIFVSYQRITMSVVWAFTYMTDT